jgi:hypothetical protein
MMIVLAALVASASAFSPAPAFTRSTRLAGQTTDWEKAKELGWSMGGQDHTRDAKVVEHEDPRKSVKAAPTFEEYMKQRAAGGN